MQNLHADLLTDLAHSHIAERVQAAARATAAGSAQPVGRLRGRSGPRRPRHRFPR